MALFGKKVDTVAQQQEALRKQQQEAARQQALAPFEIHTMPQRFKPVVEKGTGGSAGVRAGLIGLLIFMVLALLGIGAFQLYRSLNVSAPSPVGNLNTAVNNVGNTATSTSLGAGNTNLNANTNLNTNGNANLNANANTNTNTNTNTNIENTNSVNSNTANTNNSNTNTTTTPSLLVSSLDTDRDGLTDTEEQLYNTQVRLPDTDGDGFTDGQEVLSLYSPIAANQLLKDSGLVNTYSDAGFSVLYPSSWLARATDASKTQILFTSSTGEVIKAEVLANPDKLSAGQFISTNETTLNPANFSALTTTGKLNGLGSADQMTYFIELPTLNSILKVTYLPGTVSRLSFLTTERMMINSLRLP